MAVAVVVGVGVGVVTDIGMGYISTAISMQAFVYE